MLINVLIFVFIGSFVSLVIASLILFSQKIVHSNSTMIAFAAGAMLAAAFFDLIPEALNKEGEGLFYSNQQILLFTLVGIVFFFFLERFLFFYHHHACPEGEECASTVPTVPLLIIGDMLHNFLDGLTIASTFLISFSLGVVTSLAVFAHEIPHEIGNFGVLLSLGVRRKSVLYLNIFSAFFAFLGAGLGFYFLKAFQEFIPLLVALAAGNFIYLSSSDLIPQLHQSFEKKLAVSQSAVFLLGVMIIGLVVNFFK
jgi:zinc and cadmium transporter